MRRHLSNDIAEEEIAEISALGRLVRKTLAENSSLVLEVCAAHDKAICQCTASAQGTVGSYWQGPERISSGGLATVFIIKFKGAATEAVL
jgi:hypothetical protein